VTPPGGTASYRPDGEVRLARHAFVGRGIYDVSRQRVTATLNGRPARTATFQVRATNRGTATDRLTIRGTSRNAQFTVAYLHGRTNVTARVLSGSFGSGALRPGQSTTLTVRITKVKGARTGSQRAFTIRTVSTHDHRKVDAVAAAVRVVR
jgi:hypothetical protein